MNEWISEKDRVEAQYYAIREKIDNLEAERLTATGEENIRLWREIDYLWDVVNGICNDLGYSPGINESEADE